jgi:MFS family permease
VAAMVAITPSNPFRVLITHRNFRSFWIGQTLSLVGSWMQSMAIGWLALELSNSAFVVGVVVASGSLPILAFSLYAGVLVDRSDKRRLVTVAQALLLLEAVLLWFLTWSGHMTVGALIALSLGAGAVQSVEIPARQALMVDRWARRPARRHRAELQRLQPGTHHRSGYRRIRDRECGYGLVLRGQRVELPHGADRISACPPAALD